MAASWQLGLIMQIDPWFTCPKIFTSLLQLFFFVVPVRYWGDDLFLAFAGLSLLDQALEPEDSG